MPLLIMSIIKNNSRPNTKTGKQTNSLRVNYQYPGMSKNQKTKVSIPPVSNNNSYSKHKRKNCAIIC